MLVLIRGIAFRIVCFVKGVYNKEEKLALIIGKKNTFLNPLNENNWLEGIRELCCSYIPLLKEAVRVEKLDLGDEKNLL